MKILRNNLEWMTHMSLNTVKFTDKECGGPNFKSGHQQQLEDLLKAIRSGESITVE